MNPTQYLGKYDCSQGLLCVLYHDGDLTVRTSSIMDRPLVDKLQKDNSFAVGFIQSTIWDLYVWGGKRNFTVFVCEKNDDPVGYVLLTPGHSGGYAKIQQIVVREDARRLDYGTALLHVVKEFCEEMGRIGVTLRCRQDLPSNLFWQDLGFDCYGVWRKGETNHVGFKASDDINLWKIELNDNILRLW